MGIQGDCAQCNKSSKNLRRCTGKCGGKVAYCSTDCQQKHWTDGGHKSQCGKVTKDHTFHPLGGFLEDIAPYLANCDRKDKVPVCYKANVLIKDGEDIHFERTRLLPKAAIERAKTDPDFDYHLCLSIALSLKKQILEKCGGDVRCHECGERASTIFQTPTVDWTAEFDGSLYPIITIRDIWCKPCCTSNDAACLEKVKGSFASFAESLATKMPEILKDVEGKIQKK
jgi:hypothetical protein